MKYFLLGTVFGLLIGWATVPIVKAAYTIDQSDMAITVPVDSDEPSIRTYKDYLRQMLVEIRRVNIHLSAIEDNTKAVKDKLHA